MFFLPESAGARLAARDFLRRQLQAGPRPAADVARAAARAGLSDAELRRARTDLGVRAEKTGFGAAGQWLLALDSSNGAVATCQHGHRPGCGCLACFWHGCPRRAEGWR